MPFRQQYGLQWKASIPPLEIELLFIRSGGYLPFEGLRYGRGLFHHHKAAQTLIWPSEDHHRWSDLVLKTMCEERITVVQGPRDAGKTRTASKWALVDYWASPDNTLTIMTSTGIRELELRVWGDIKTLYERGKEAFPWLPGNMNQANHGIFTDALDDRGDVRDFRRSLICVPLIGGDGEWRGLDRFVGMKQDRRRLIGDECQFVPVTYVNTLDAFDKQDFKGAFLGNAIGGNGKALDKLAEPVGGWSTLGEVTKTKTWRNKYDGITINLVGSDSPNFDKNRPKSYPYLIDKSDIDKIVKRNGIDSPQYWTLALGIRKTGADAYKILPFELCERAGAFNTVIWSGAPRTRIYAVDAGFGGDPCETMFVEFGENVDGDQIICFHESGQVQIQVSSPLSPEDQIALAVKKEAGALGVPDENIFFDAGMRATLAVSFSRTISPQVNAVNFGGPATDRPVDEDTFIIDPKTKQRRLVKCSEQYSKFVTEMCYSVRGAVETEQVRGLPKSAAEEFANREWHWVPGPLGERYELETKPEYKTRNNGNSPNKSDVTMIGLEGARRLGFQIRKARENKSDGPEVPDWLEAERKKHRRFREKHELKLS